MSSHDQPSQQAPKEQGHSEHSGMDHRSGRAQYVRFGLMILTSSVVM
jgi:hypothetical protein